MTFPTEEILRKGLGEILPKGLGILRTMVGINSFTSHAKGVDALNELTAEVFKPLGFRAEAIQSETSGYGRHLILSRGSGGEKPVVLVSHLDTVYPPEEETRNEFCWMDAPEEGRIYGPGTIDIKGGTVLIWMMLRVLSTHAPEWFERAEWRIVFNASEEVMARDFAARVEERCPEGARAVLVFEGGPREGKTFQVVTARKGRAEYQIRSHGRGAHAGSAHAEGRNAIVGIAEAVQRVASFTDYEQKLTVNVGTITGGTVLNRVPHQAEAALEIRAFDPAVLDGACRKIEALGSEGKAPFGGHTEVKCLGISPSWPGDERDKVLVEYWKFAGESLGIDVVPVARGGLSDANYLHRLGPTLDGLGPSGGNAHCSERTADRSRLPEFVEPDSFVIKGTLNLLGLQQILSKED